MEPFQFLGYSCILLIFYECIATCLQRILREIKNDIRQSSTKDFEYTWISLKNNKDYILNKLFNKGE